MRTFEITEMPDDVVGVQACTERPELSNLNHVFFSNFGELYTLDREDVPQLIKALQDFMQKEGAQVAEAKKHERTLAERLGEY